MLKIMWDPRFVVVHNL